MLRPRTLDRAAGGPRRRAEQGGALRRRVPPGGRGREPRRRAPGERVAAVEAGRGRPRRHRQEVRPVRRAARREPLDPWPGEFVCFLGPSGCGKTTLLRIVAGLERQNAGQVMMGGRDVSGLPPSLRNYGIVFQSYALFPNLTVARNVAYGLETRRTPRAGRSSAESTSCWPWSVSRRHKAQVPRAALGRRAAARRAGARARAVARAAPAGRAALGARRARAPDRSATRSARCSGGSASPPSWSRTTRRRRSPWPTASWS